MSAGDVLAYAFSAMDRLGITPIIQGFFIALIAIGVITAIYSRMNRN